MFFPKLHRFLLPALFLVYQHIQAQQDSRILRSSTADSVVTKVQMKDAFYDASKNFLPYYHISKPTMYEQDAKPTLIIKKTAIVTGNHEKALRTSYSRYLDKEYSLTSNGGRSRNSNFNNYSLIPFRINETGQVEELIEYDLTWNVTSSAMAAKSSVANFKSSSVLSSGTWYKIGVTQTGIHKISKTFLTNLGINITSDNIRKLKLYGNGGAMLPEKNKDFRYDDLEENEILVVDGNDGSFDNADYILFYASGPTGWQRRTKSQVQYNAVKNLYSDTSFYFISPDQAGDGKRVSTRSSLSNANVTSSTYDYYNFHEEDAVNFAKSGRRFFGERFETTTTYNFGWGDGNFVTGDTVKAEVTIAAANNENTNFQVTSSNGVSFGLIVPSLPDGQYSPYAYDDTKIGKALNVNSSELAFTISKTSAKGVGWLDKITVNARRQIFAGSKQFNFRDTRVSKKGNVCNFVITSPSSTLTVWNVTEGIHPFVQAINVISGGYDFTANADSLNEYCVVPGSDFYTPTFVGKVPNQNLHSLQQADYLIITHPLLLREAQRLGAFNEKQDGLTYAVVTIDQVYNEFGSGRPDISAIRDFIRMVYSRNVNARHLRYVCLVGDGSYNNKTRSLLNNSNLIPTYQGHESFSSTVSLATDDFYALMDPNEGYFAEDSGAVDIGVGRFTCRTPGEAKAVMDKIENYYKADQDFKIHDDNILTAFNSSRKGDWQNWLLFLADDGDHALHMDQSNQLSEMVRQINPNYNHDKIFIDAYQRFSTPGGARYPDASEDFLRRIKKGALIFNYTGHGGEVGLTGERLIDVEIINNLDNFNRLALFITATCEFSRYDDPARTSAGELSLLNPKGGAIALLTTVRLAFADANFLLNQVLLERLFTRDSTTGLYPTIGEAMEQTKATLGQRLTYSNFHLLGDPALRLAYPHYKVITTKINNIDLSNNSSDTLSALAKISVSGYVADESGNKLNNFNGLVYPTVFDKEQKTVALMNVVSSGTNFCEGCPPPYIPFSYKSQKNILYRGKAEATGGEFSFTFIVPKDISFAPGPGKISYYATNGSDDAHGYYTKVVVGGESGNIVNDSEGPRVNLFLNDRNFVSGAVTNENPVLYAELVDSSGINTVGTGLGHDLSVVLDADASKPVILNDYYEADVNSYQSGKIRYPFNELPEGEHRLAFKVWDIQNNSNTAYTDFVVAPSAELALQQVLNYPNPFTTNTQFFFQHNQACNPLKVVIQVYTVTGKIVKTIQAESMCNGYKPTGIAWDGKDDYGAKLGRGVYIYRLAILDINNKKAEKIEKLVILN